MTAKLAKGKWRTARDAWNWLGSKFNLGDVKEATIYKYLGKCAGFHHKKDEETLPEKVRIITLPAYSPEINPVKKLWDIVKDGICNRDWVDLDELKEKITERIKPYWADARRVTRLFGNGYLLSELNAIWKRDFRQSN